MDTNVSSSPEIANRTDICAIFNIWSLGVVVVIGGNFFIWNEGLAAGLAPFLISAFLFGTGYIALVFCIAEILSGLPFSGGAYGLVRCSVGFYPGFLVACSEIAYYVTYASISVSAFGCMLCHSLGVASPFQPLIWLFSYIFLCARLVCIHSLSFF